VPQRCHSASSGPEFFQDRLLTKCVRYGTRDPQLPPPPALPGTAPADDAPLGAPQSTAVTRRAASSIHIRPQLRNHRRRRTSTLACKPKPATNKADRDSPHFCRETTLQSCPEHPTKRIFQPGRNFSFLSRTPPRHRQTPANAQLCPVALSPIMLLRLRGPDGMARVTCETSTTFGELGKLVSEPSVPRAVVTADEAR